MEKRLWEILTIDHIISVIIISIVVTWISSVLPDTKKSMFTAASTTEAIGVLRTPMSVYYAIHGEWPEDYETIREFFPQFGNINSGMKNEIRMSKGVIQIKFHRFMPGQVLTVHPATLTGDPLGPVKWTASMRGITEGWTAWGEDETTMDDGYIPKVLKH